MWWHNADSVCSVGQVAEQAAEGAEDGSNKKFLRYKYPSMRKTLGNFRLNVRSPAHLVLQRAVHTVLLRCMGRLSAELRICLPQRQGQTIVLPWLCRMLSC